MDKMNTESVKNGENRRIEKKPTLSEIEDIISGLEATFHFSAAMWIPLIALAVAIFFKLPATYSLLASAVAAIFVAIFAQGYSASEVIGFLYSGVSMDSGNEVVDTILFRGEFPAYM